MAKQPYTNKTITIDYRWGDKLMTIIENVPAGLCQICGEQYLKAEVVKEMERIANSEETPKRMLQVPLRELMVV